MSYLAPDVSDLFRADFLAAFRDGIRTYFADWQGTVPANGVFVSSEALRIAPRIFATRFGIDMLAEDPPRFSFPRIDGAILEIENKTPSPFSGSLVEQAAKTTLAANRWQEAFKPSPTAADLKWWPWYAQGFADVPSKFAAADGDYQVQLGYAYFDPRHPALAAALEQYFVFMKTQVEEPTNFLQRWLGIDSMPRIAAEFKRTYDFYNRVRAALSQPPLPGVNMSVHDSPIAQVPWKPLLWIGGAAVAVTGLGYLTTLLRGKK